MIMKHIMSLEHTALVKVASTLWNQDDIKALIADYSFGVVPSTDQEQWDKIEDKVREKVPQLNLPMYLREIVSCFIKCVGVELLKWMQCCCEKGNVCIKLLNNIVWTPQGTIDKKKTAKILIKKKTIHILTRYKLADVVWLMDDIDELWNKIPKDHRRNIFSKEEQLKIMANRPIPNRHTHIRLPDYLGEADELGKKSRDELALETAAAEDANLAAVEYLLQKLPPEEREKVLPSVADAVGLKICEDFSTKPYTDILWFLFTEMNEQQQIELFKKYPIQLCRCLLEYPNQSFFMETVSCMWSYFQGISFYFILEMIINKVFDNCKDYNYKKLFREFWSQSPPAIKCFVMDESYVGRLLYRLCQIKDMGNVKLILESMARADNKKLTSSEIPKCISRCIMYFNDWDFLDLFVRECVSSKDEMVRFAGELKKYVMQLYSEDCNLATDEEKKNRLFHLLDDLISKYNKRKCVEDDASNPTKMPCSAERQVDSRVSQ